MTLPALTELTQMDRPALALRWENTFGVHAPKGCQATLLRQALAWQVQMTALKTRVGARKADRGVRALRTFSSSAAIAPGTRLLREWRGRTHHVVAVDGGFEYDGRVWRSLSAISRAITGSTWSGPLFFGLRS